MAEAKNQLVFKKSNIGLSVGDKVGLTSNLHTMLAAGIPIMEVINSLLEDSKGNQKKILTAIRDDLVQGQHLYYSFSRFPKVFDKVTVSIIKAAEEAGTLDQALADLRSIILKEREFNDKIKGAMIYPAFIFAVLIVVLTVILVVVVPKVSTVFGRLNVELPLPTKIMIAASNALLEYPVYIIVGIVIFGLGFFYLFKRYRIFFIRALTSLPVINNLARQIDLARFSRSLFLLLSAGIPITKALELSQEVVVKKEIYDAINSAKAGVFAGKKFSEGLKVNKKYLPSIMIKIVEAGEKSGSLNNSMKDVSEYLDYEVASTLKTVTALIEPFMLIFVGVLIGGMMVSIISPMYSLIGQVGGTGGG